jgi:Ca2+-binding EF-hand superfamily protein
MFDRNIAIEVFQELDSNRDGKIHYKDFKDAMLFEL